MIFHKTKKEKPSLPYTIIGLLRYFFRIEITKQIWYWIYKPCSSCHEYLLQCDFYHVIDSKLWSRYFKRIYGKNKLRFKLKKKYLFTLYMLIHIWCNKYRLQVMISLYILSRVRSFEWNNWQFRAAIGMGQHTRERTAGVVFCLICTQLGGKRNTVLIFRTWHNFWKQSNR